MGRFDAIVANAPSATGLTEMEVVEIPVLLPGWQATALEDAAHERGLTAGEMLRHLLADFLKPPGYQTDARESRRNGPQVALS